MYKLRWFSKGPRRSYLLEPHKYTMLSELVNRNCQIPHNGFYQMDQMEAKTLLDQALAAPPRDPRAAGATSPLCFEACKLLGARRRFHGCFASLSAVGHQAKSVRSLFGKMII